jgi:hypothetical protein
MQGKKIEAHCFLLTSVGSVESDPDCRFFCKLTSPRVCFLPSSVNDIKLMIFVKELNRQLFKSSIETFSKLQRCGPQSLGHATSELTTLHKLSFPIVCISMDTHELIFFFTCTKAFN